MKYQDPNKIYRLIEKACYDYNLINDGDKILLGASGGKDSTLLAQYFSLLKKRPNLNFQITALNIQSDFAPPIPAEIRMLFEKWNIEFKSVNVDILSRLKDGKKMNCWWCSTQRRKELLEYAVAKGYNKIALGHHMDDVLETVIMNALNKIELSTMKANFKYDKFPVSVIRPLYYLTENQIINHAKKEGYLGFTCTCNYQENSDRKIARKKLDELCDYDDEKKSHLFYSLKNIRQDFLP